MIQIIGHRGASGMYPEHTALAYRYRLQSIFLFRRKTQKAVEQADNKIEYDCTLKDH